MGSRVLAALVAFALVVVGLGTGWVVGMRNKGSAVVRAQRRINRSLLNPRQVATAGQPGAAAALIRHVGRTSGRSYETPVGAERTPDGFVVALVYGPDVDWIKNVQAAGTATIVADGQAHAVHRPEVVRLDANLEHFPNSMSGTARLMNVTQCLRVYHTA